MESILINFLVLITVTCTNTEELGDLFEKIARHFYGCFASIRGALSPSLIPRNVGSQVKLASTWQDNNPGSSVPLKNRIWAPTLIITTCNVDTRRCFNVYWYSLARIKIPSLVVRLPKLSLFPPEIGTLQFSVAAGPSHRWSEVFRVGSSVYQRRSTALM